MSTFSTIRLRLWLAAALLGSALLLLGACADGDGDEDADAGPDVMTTETPTGSAVATEATPTVEGTATESATATETVTAPEVVERDDISFVSPEGWVGNEDTWTSPDGEVTLLFASSEREPGSEPEAVMLPQGAVNLDREEIETPLGPGAIHTVELVEATDQGIYEMHALVPTEDRIYDWWFAAETREDLNAHRDVLEAVIASIEPGD